MKIEWQKCVGESGYENAYSIAENHDKGFIAACYTILNEDDFKNYHGGSDARRNQ